MVSSARFLSSPNYLSPSCAQLSPPLFSISAASPLDLGGAPPSSSLLTSPRGARRARRRSSEGTALGARARSGGARLGGNDGAGVRRALQGTRGALAEQSRRGRIQPAGDLWWHGRACASGGGGPSGPAAQQDWAQEGPSSGACVCAVLHAGPTGWRDWLQREGAARRSPASRAVAAQADWRLPSLPRHPLPDLRPWSAPGMA